MIKKLSIRNFQSHKRTEMEFHSGVNVILGTTDSGKTAVIRALRWVMQNKPSGEDFRSVWGGATSVSVETNDGTVKRKKDANENSYTIIKEGDRSVFTAFGQGVPEPVEQLFNMDEVNLQQQLDAPFLLSDTPGMVASYFNRIAGLDVINTANKAAQKEVNDTERLIRIREGDIKKSEEQFEKYKNLDVLEVKIEELEDKEKTRNNISRSRVSLTSLLAKLITVKEKLKNAKVLLGYEKMIAPIVEKINERKSKRQRVQNLKLLIGKLQKVVTEINETKQLLNHESKVNELIGKLTLKSQKKTTLNKFRQLLGKYNDLTQYINEKHIAIQDKTNLFNQHLIVCPLCGTNLKNKKK